MKLTFRFKNLVFRPVYIITISLLQIKKYEKLEAVEDRRKLAREIYDNFIMKELLAHSHVSTRISNIDFPLALLDRLFFCL